MGTTRVDIEAYAETHARALARAAVLLTGDTDSAQDLCQEMLARMVTAWPHLRSTDAAHTYALRVMTRLYRRQQKRHWSGERTVEALPDVPLTGPDLADAMDVQAGLARLPAGQRAALVLRYYADLSVEETANVLRCSEGNVKSQCSRGLARLAELLAGNEATRSGL